MLSTTRPMIVRAGACLLMAAACALVPLAAGGPAQALAPMLPAVCETPQAEVSPATVAAGETVDLSACGLAEDETVTIDVQGTSSWSLQSEADAFGRLDVPITLEDPGEVRLVISSSQGQAYAQVTVTGGTEPSPSPSPSPEPDPTTEPTTEPSPEETTPEPSPEETTPEPSPEPSAEPTTPEETTPAESPSEPAPSEPAPSPDPEDGSGDEDPSEETSQAPTPQDGEAQDDEALDGDGQNGDRQSGDGTDGETSETADEPTATDRDDQEVVLTSPDAGLGSSESDSRTQQPRDGELARTGVDLTLGGLGIALAIAGAVLVTWSGRRALRD